MSSDRLERKRRSEFDTSDESADELPPAKVRKTEQASSFRKVLSDKLKSVINWFSPRSFKDYMIDFVKSSFGQPQPSTSALNMRLGEMKNSIDDDEDEISVISVQNGTSNVHPRLTSGQRLPHARGSRHGNTLICPLASTPIGYPALSNSSSSLIEKNKLLERRQMNGYANREDLLKRKRKEGEKCVAPFTNPSSDIEILLEKPPRTKDKEVVSATPSSPKSQRSLIDFYKGSCKDGVQYAEQLMHDTSSYFQSSKSDKKFTALEVVRLKEKEEYRLLLNKVVRQTIYSPAIPKRNAYNSIIQVDLTEENDKSVYHFKKEKVAHVAEFFTKCYKPCALVPFKCKSTESRSEKETDEGVQLVAGSDLPKFIPRNNRLQVVSGSLFSQSWINDFKTSIEIDKRKHLQLVSEQNDKLLRYKKRRDARIAEDQRWRDEHRSSGIIFPNDVEMQDTLPEITPKMEEIISAALRTPGEISKIDNVSLTVNDIATLTKLNWLNDQVINCYMFLIAERSKLDNYPSVHVFNSYFYSSLKTRGIRSVIRWTRRIDIFGFDMILVPLHLGMHWALMFIDNRSKQIKYYDSMGSSEEHCLRIIQDYLIGEMLDKKKIAMDPNSYSLEIPKDIPKQMNGSDCGMFTLKYAEYLSRDAPITFTQENMPYFRRRMIYELKTKQIL